MADEQYDELESEEQEQPKRNFRRVLEERATEAERKAQEAEAKYQEMERKLALRDAGLSLSEKQIKAFVAAHEGEWSPEAVKATAEALGFSGAPKVEVPAAEVAAHQRMQEASAGAITPPAAPAASALKLQEIRDRLYSGDLGLAAGITESDVKRAIQEAGLQFGQIPHDGTFTPIK